MYLSCVLHSIDKTVFQAILLDILALKMGAKFVDVVDGVRP